MKKYAFIILLICFFSCTSEEDKKQQMVQYVSKSMCKGVSAEIGNSMANSNTENEEASKIVANFLSSLDVPIEKFCHCFSGIIGQELQSKFTYEELIEIKKDKIKMLLVGKKILEQNNIQANISDCLKGTIEAKTNEYKKFNDSLDKKFDKK